MIFYSDILEFQLFLEMLLQCDNMAREGLRTLVVAKKTLTEEQYSDFDVSTFCLKLNLSQVFRWLVWNDVYKNICNWSCIV